MGDDEQSIKEYEQEVLNTEIARKIYDLSLTLAIRERAKAPADLRQNLL